ncbi:MAG TPA: response regulator [Methanomassiliicoccales archaeon]|jgi:CheY-like chemotaxis protein
MKDKRAVEILVIEDDPNDAELIIRVLKKVKLTNNLVLLKDGEEALEFLNLNDEHPEDEDGQPKVILLDLKLPKVNGIEVLRKIKSDQRTKNIPVVIMTSSKEERDIKEAYELGVNSYVTKPINFDEFAKAVANLGMYWLLLNKSPED